MEGMTLLQMPVALPLWGLASLKTSRAELRCMLGEPHFVETDPTRTCGGEEDGWAYTLPSGQRMLIVLDVPSGFAELFGDPPALGPILQALRIPPNDPRLLLHEQPWAVR
jgi:hypothetical protein